MPMIDPEHRAFIFKKIGYTPHSAEQSEAHDSDARFKTVCCGRRWGKTTFGANEMTAALCDPSDPGYFWIVGPNYVQGEKEFRIVYDNIFKKMQLSRGAKNQYSKIKKQYNVPQGLMRIEMPWGSVLEVKSAERQESLLGEGLAGVIMAEAARHTSVTWEQYIRPALTDRKGWAIFSSTPRGYNWFQGLWLLGQLRTLHPSYQSWRFPSWSNPILFPGGRDDPEIKEMEARQSPQWFAQEIGAEFTAFTGKIYDEFDIQVHVKPIEYNPLWTNAWALDYGWSNPFACYDVMIDPEDSFHIWREYQVAQKTTFEHAGSLMERENPQDYHADWGAGDPRGPDQANTISIITGVQIYSEDIGQGNTHESWTLGIEHMRRLLKIRPDGTTKMTIDPSCTELIRQMEQLRAIEEKEGKNATEGQHKHDDHGPDAVRYLAGQYFENGAGSALSDIYTPGSRQTEAATFFQNNSPLERYGRF